MAPLGPMEDWPPELRSAACRVLESRFGSRLIDVDLMGAGSVERRYPPAGGEVDLRVPVRDLQER